MAFWRKTALFCLGGSSYCTLEILFRGRTHGSMFLAGGVCFLLLGGLNRARPRLPGWLRYPVGALIITMVELAVGLVVNQDYHVWDYRAQPGNFLGQICLPYCLLWMPVGLAGAEAYRFLDKKMMHT